jgi:hypothetical protein
MSCSTRSPMGGVVQHTSTSLPPMYVAQQRWPDGLKMPMKRSSAPEYVVWYAPGETGKFTLYVQPVTSTLSAPDTRTLVMWSFALPPKYVHHAHAEPVELMRAMKPSSDPGRFCWKAPAVTGTVPVV